MNGREHIRLATHADAPSLLTLARAIAMPGAIGLCMTREPDFFGALEVEGQRQAVVVGECDGRLVGYGVASAKDMLVNGVTRRMGYLSGLRLLPEYRHGAMLSRGYRLLKEAVCPALGVAHFVSTVMEDNTDAIRLLTSGRGGLPEYRDIGRYVTHVLPVRRGTDSDAATTVVSGDAVGRDAVAAALRDLGNARQFFPAYRPEDIGGDRGVLRGLALAQFFVVERQGRIAGVAAYWDQTWFRQHVVTGYGGIMRIVKPMHNAWALVKGGGRLPKAGAAVSAAYAACVAVAGDDPVVFSALLKRLRCRARQDGKQFLMIGLAENDPLAPLLRRAASMRLHSRMYVVSWDDPQPFIPPRGRVCYLELGSL